MSASTATDVTPALLGLALALVSARLGGHLATKARVPTVLGELGAGITLGALGGQWFAHVRTHPALTGFAELGVMLLLFEVGLDTELSEMRRVGRAGALVALVGVALPCVLGALVSRALQPDLATHAHVFVGATLAATSVGITARVLRDLGRTRTVEARVILAAAVLDDVLGLLLLALVTSAVNAANAGTGSLGYGQLALIVGRSLGFLVAAVLLGRPLVRGVLSLAARVSGSAAPVTAPVALCLAFGWAAHASGLASVVGAFVAGLLIEPKDYAPLRARGGGPLEEPLAPLAAVFVPGFFVLTGAAVDLRSFADRGTLLVALALTVAAVVGKLVAGLAAHGSGARLWVVGVGMIPRGEVGLLFAAIGASLTLRGKPVISPALFGAVVFVVVVSTVLPPPLLARWAKGLPDEREAHPERAHAHAPVAQTEDRALAIVRVSLDIVALVEAALAPLRGQAEALDVSLSLENSLPEAARTVAVDAEKIAWCVATLVGNGLRHVERGTQAMHGGAIRVEVGAGEGGVRVTVRDDGPGIPGEKLAHLFAPAAGSALPAGFALPLVRAVVEAHGGALSVESRTDEEEHGTAVTLALPTRAT